ncbi:hypothetical protein HF521_017018 [Silurus meridionalis]|uniref:Uncharacterized protein n=1 Tax=Silurus meridionalis TaxID=175797 RepID=A0A8T0BL10_SILME|nr:hypothetical protein HF521_017018 [Silurus meridionalis]
MEERNNIPLQAIRELQDSLNLCEKENNNLMRDRDQLETRLAMQEATLLSEQNKLRKEKEKAKQDLEEMTTSHLQTTRKLQDSLNHCEEEKKRAEHKRNNLMREQAQLEELVVQLEDILEFWLYRMRRSLSNLWSDSLFLFGDSTRLPRLKSLSTGALNGVAAFLQRNFLYCGKLYRLFSSRSLLQFPQC